MQGLQSKNVLLPYIEKSKANLLMPKMKGREERKKNGKVRRMDR